MTTLVQMYVKGIRQALADTVDFPARVELSVVRAQARSNKPTVVVLPGAEAVQDGATPRVTRQREIHLMVHSAGDDHLEQCEDVFEAAQPVVMGYQADSIVQIEELRTDEPRYVDGDLTRQVVTKRYLITYQTADDSLSQ